MCKIAHNVMLGVVIENLIEITLLTNKMGVPRHAFLAFLNNSAMGSMFTRYKSPALVNLDWTTTFTPELLRKDIDLGLELGARERRADAGDGRRARGAAGHFGAATLQPDPEKYLAERLRRPDRDHGAGGRHEAREREQDRADGLERGRELISPFTLVGALIFALALSVLSSPRPDAPPPALLAPT